MVGTVGKKVGMTCIYDENSHIHPCTVIEAEECVVTQIKTKEKDGYEAIQFGYYSKKSKNISKPKLGHLKKSNKLNKSKFFEIRNFRSDYDKEIKLGDSISVADIFEEGDFVDVIGMSKGKGFQGVVKRHNFSGVGDKTHGQHNRQRSPGSIGGASYPSRVFKGMKMAGRTGGKKIKMQNLKILKIFNDKKLIVVKGAVPGFNNSFVSIQK